MVDPLSYFSSDLSLMVDPLSYFSSDRSLMVDPLSYFSSDLSLIVDLEALIFRDHGIADGNAEKPI